jgi:hypothetical protein
MKDLFKDILFRLFACIFVLFTVISLTQRYNGEYGILLDNTYSNVIVLTTFTLFSIISSYFLGYFDHDKLIYRHLSRLYFRGFYYSIIPIALTFVTKDFYNLLLVPYCWSIFYFFFELFYNKFRNFDPWRTGHTASLDLIILKLRAIKIRNFPIGEKFYPAWFILMKLSFFIIFSIILIKFWF